MSYQILLYYKYAPIADPETLRLEQRALCEKLNLKGRIILAAEGINGTVEGLIEDTEKYITAMVADPRFADIVWKKSAGDGHSFPKLAVRVRSEIVSAHLGDDDVKPWEMTGKHLPAEELKSWFEKASESNIAPEDRDFIIVDMRNDYEHKSGYFKDSILPPLTNFRDLPQVLPLLEKYKDKKIVPVCTGGVRCEKASGYLIKKGFKNVYQLEDGIVTYMEKYPNQEFIGKLYVFDKRHVVGVETDSPDHQIVGRCDVCQAPCDNYADCANLMCHIHFIACDACRDAEGRAFCSNSCRKAVVGQKSWFSMDFFKKLLSR